MRNSATPDAVAEAFDRLSAVSGLPLERCSISRLGILASGARLAGVSAGRGLEIALSRTATSASAVIMPEDSAGGLVRRLGRWAQDNPVEWASAVAEVDSQDVQLTLTVNGEMLDDLLSVPDGLWRTFTIECWSRSQVRSAFDIEQSLVKVGAPALALALSGLIEQEDEVQLPSFEPLPEGAATTVRVNRYERSPINRLRCISHYGSSCWVCGFDFGERYGSPAVGFIEVHHRVPVSEMGGEYRVDPIRDLVPLCSNCHSVIHRRTPPYHPAELRELLGLEKKFPPLPALRLDISQSAKTVDYIAEAVVEAVRGEGGTSELHAVNQDSLES